MTDKENSEEMPEGNEIAPKEVPTPRFDPESLGQAISDKNGDDDAIYVDDMYGDWFLDYASYVILERAVPHADDGLKPVHENPSFNEGADDGEYKQCCQCYWQHDEVSSTW